MKWSLFLTAMISSAVDSYGRKRLGAAAGSEKRMPLWNQAFKKAIRAKKGAFKALLQNRSSFNLQSQNCKARKVVALAVKISKERSWKLFGRRSDSNELSANNIFWQTIRRLRAKNLNTTTSIKDSTGTILRNEKEIFSRWREHYEDLLNPVTSTITETCDSIN